MNISAVMRGILRKLHTDILDYIRNDEETTLVEDKILFIWRNNGGSLHIAVWDFINKK